MRGTLEEEAVSSFLLRFPDASGWLEIDATLPSLITRTSITRPRGRAGLAGRQREVSREKRRRGQAGVRDAGEREQGVAGDE